MGKLFLIIIGISILYLNFISSSTDICSEFKFKLSSLDGAVLELRFLRVASMLLSGCALSVAGFLLQDYFKNPLAGPSVVGITPIAALISVSFGIFLRPYIVDFPFASFGLGLWSCLITFGVFLLLQNVLLRNSNVYFLIILGFLLNSLCAAILSLLQMWGTDGNLRSLVLWELGSTSVHSLSDLGALFLFVLIGFILAKRNLPFLYSRQLGAEYAVAQGYYEIIESRRIILSCCLLAASVTSYIGPIAFLGVIVPHFVRQFLKSGNFGHIVLWNMFMGSILLSLFSALSEILKLPINLVATLAGIPIIAIILLKSVPTYD